MQYSGASETESISCRSYRLKGFKPYSTLVFKGLAVLDTAFKRPMHVHCTKAACTAFLARGLSRMQPKAQQGEHCKHAMPQVPVSQHVLRAALLTARSMQALAHCQRLYRCFVLRVSLHCQVHYCGTDAGATPGMTTPQHMVTQLSANITQLSGTQATAPFWRL